MRQTVRSDCGEGDTVQQTFSGAAADQYPIVLVIPTPRLRAGRRCVGMTDRTVSCYRPLVGHDVDSRTVFRAPAH